MKKLFLVGGLVAAGVGLFTGQWLLIGVGVLATVFGALAHALDAAKSSAKEDLSELGAEARWLLRPIKELRDSLHGTAVQAENLETRVIAGEAAAEADEILRKATDMVAVREELKRSLKGQGEAETNLGRLERQVATALSEEERHALQTAIEARKAELSSYQVAKTKVAEIDSRLKVAEATLAELRARLQTGQVAGDVTGHEAEFNDLVQRLRTLGRSLDEARELVQDQEL